VSDGVAADTTALSTTAAEECLRAWGRDRNDIGLLIFAGMTRTEYISEPAIATFVAGELKINDCIQSGHDRKTLAFDVYNTSLAFLNACQAASLMIRAGRCRTAMVVTSEVEMNVEHFPEQPLGIVQAGSAVILETTGDSRQGFGSFVYRYATEHQQARTLLGRYRDGRPFCDLQVDPRLQEYYLELVPSAVEELLGQEGLTIGDIRILLPSQFSSEFNAQLADRLGIPREKLVDLGGQRLDYLTNSLPFSLRRAREQGRLEPGDVGLIVHVASGIQVGCATYYF
jgi:3-oxoacyl-[acyl-carrier-protein] synthase III